MKKILFIFLIIHCTLNIENCFSQWVFMNNGMGNKEVDAFTYSGNNIFAGTGSQLPSGVYLSTNSGATWTPTPLNSHIISSLAANGSNIFAGCFNYYGVYRSTNNGTSWTQTTTLNNQWAYSLAINGNNIFAGAYGVWLSTNNGTSWTQTSLNNQTVGTLAINGNNIFAGANDVYLSTNNGTSWTQTFLNQTVSSLGVNGSNVFVGTLNIRVYLSTNNGVTWTQTTFNNWVLSFAFNGNNVFAGTSNSGVYVSTDNGTSWTQRNEGLGSNTNIRELCIFNNYIFAGTGAKGMGGVFRRPLSELTGIQPISTEIPNQFSLSQNYPNPFNPNTIIKFKIKDSRLITLKVFDLLGREVATLVNEQLQPGTYEVDWDGSGFASGVYYYKLVAGEYTETRKMVLLR